MTIDSLLNPTKDICQSIHDTVVDPEKPLDMALHEVGLLKNLHHNPASCLRGVAKGVRQTAAELTKRGHSQQADKALERLEQLLA